MGEIDRGRKSTVTIADLVGSGSEKPSSLPCCCGELPATKSVAPGFDCCRRVRPPPCVLSEGNPVGDGEPKSVGEGALVPATLRCGSFRYAGPPRFVDGPPGWRTVMTPSRSTPREPVAWPLFRFFSRNPCDRLRRIVSLFAGCVRARRMARSSMSTNCCCCLQCLAATASSRLTTAGSFNESATAQPPPPRPSGRAVFLAPSSVAASGAAVGVPFAGGGLASG
mmetsp:Transcript_5987/g.17932  ORF Transcript_5987/g.17932 Transcript_5987/m.17932 type:complete len:224 (-) Transcript_5987:157-828(-)